jgi:hypothetical protein
MTKNQFLELLGKAYSFPDYYSLNLDSADEILSDLKEEESKDKLSLRMFFDTLLSEETEEERRKIWELLEEHLGIE